AELLRGRAPAATRLLGARRVPERSGSGSGGRAPRLSGRGARRRHPPSRTRRVGRPTLIAAVNRRRMRQLLQPQPPPQQPPGTCPLALPVAVENENRRRTRSLPHEGHASAVSTETELIGRRSSNGCSQARQMYS